MWRKRGFFCNVLAKSNKSRRPQPPRPRFFYV
ncbi:hypothetical protein ABIC65_000738 [Sphingomonas trueperi]